MSCAICFCPIEGATIKCCDPRCLNVLCVECTVRFIDVVHSDATGQKLSCVRDGCEGEYDQLSIASLPSESQKKYREILLAHFFKANKSEIEEREKHNLLILKMKEERNQFYTDNMPPAILRVANIAFADRLKKVKKVEAKKQAEQLGRVCINFFCGGFLDKDFKCCKCMVTFCTECEEEKKDGHVCRPEVKQSVAFVKTMRACPECGTRIEKGEGCMAMTCAVCNTNFWYSTGEKGDAGNHGQSIPVVVKAFGRLSVEYGETVPPFLRPHLKKIEEKFKKQTASDESLLHIATQARQTERLVEFSSLYTKNLRDKMEKMMLGKKLSQIEKLLSEKPGGYLNMLTEVLLPNVNRKVLMYKGEKRDGVIYAEQFGVAQNERDVCKKLRLELYDLINSIETNNGVLGDYYFHYESEKMSE